MVYSLWSMQLWVCDAVQVSQSLKSGSVKRVRHSELWEDHAANLLDASKVKCLSVLLFCLLRPFIRFRYVVAAVMRTIAGDRL